MSIKSIAATAAIMMAIGMPVQAHTGSERASTTFRIQGFVPVICRVQLSASVGSPDQNGIADLGVADEFCNAPRGYRVTVQHAPGLEGAALINGGVRIPLSSTGETVLTDSNRPDLRKVALAVDLGDHPERFNSLSVRIEAKG